jgi:hypothetical protein
LSFAIGAVVRLVVHGGMDARTAGDMGLINAMPIMLVIGLAAVVVLLFAGLLLKPLPKQESPDAAANEKRTQQTQRNK